ncbi:MAG: CBS domain-containing protein [Alphaproteobacteria bacterium]|nr:CBS domain-containing protein [Alphaproteobacteria bacterium]
MKTNQDDSLFAGIGREPVRALMHPTVIMCEPETAVADAAATMALNKCGSIIIARAGNPLGIWTEMDALRLNLDHPGIFEQPVSNFMNAPLISIPDNASLQDAAVKFREHSIRHLIVVDIAGLMIGIISQTDVVLKLGIQSYLSFRVVGSVAFRPALTLPHDIGVGETIGQLFANGLDAALVTENGEPVGIITERDVVRLIARRADDVRIGDVATRPLVSISIDAPLIEARNLLEARRFRHLVITGPDGEVRGILTMTDILAAMEHGYVHHLEEVLTRKSRQLESTERRLDLILRSAGDSVVGLDAAGQVTFANTAAAELLGWPENAILGRNWCDLVCHSCPEQHETCLATQSCRTETATRLDSCSFTRRDGSVFPAEVTTSPLAEGDRHVGGVLVFRDITERKAAEAALHEERNFTKAVIESLPGIFYVIDRDSRFDLWNHNFEAVSGYGADEIRRMHPMDFFAGTEKILVAERMEEVFAVGHATIEANFVTRTGQRIPYFFTGSRLLTSHGDKFVGTGVDIATRQQMEEMLRRSNRDLKAFAYVASHDLRQPLRMVRSYLQLLEQKLGKTLDQEARDYMAFAVDGAVRMDRLIIDLLEYARVGRTTEPPGWVDVRDVIHEVLDMFKLSIDEYQATVTVEGEHWPQVFADHGEMFRLFQNLIGNSLKYRPLNKPLHISLSFRHRERLWEFAVRDNGIGIDPVQFERIFGIFQRLHAVGDYAGSGIGLAICKKIVEHHDGLIWVESEPGQGSTFFFSLPDKSE